MIDLPPEVYTPVFGTLITVIGTLFKLYLESVKKYTESEASKLDILKEEAEASKQMALAVFQEKDLKKEILERIKKIEQDVDLLKQNQLNR